MSLRLIAVANMELGDVITLQEGVLSYRSGMAGPIFEGVRTRHRLAGKGDLTDTQLYNAMSGFTNGYVRISAS